MKIINIVTTVCVIDGCQVWLLNQIPGPKGIPVLGNALYFNVDATELFQRVLKVTECGEVSRMWMVHNPFCFLSSAKTAEVLLSSHKLLDKGMDYEFLHPWLGLNLLTFPGSLWHTRRKLVSPAFHFKILEEFVSIFNKQSCKLVQKLEKKADGNTFDIFDDVTLCVLDAICETAMGRCINAQEDSESEYVQAARKMSGYIQYRIFRPWLHSDIMYKLLGPAKESDACLKILHHMSNTTIKEKKQNKNKNKSIINEEETLGIKKRRAFLDLLLDYAEENPEFTDEEIRKEVDTFMFAGYDTTASAMNWILYNLGHHPDIQARVHEELDGILINPDSPVTTEDVRQMKYTEMCIKESMRLFPPAPVISRTVNEDVVIDGYCIPAGTTVSIVIYKIHRDPTQFPDPEVFDPDRFLPENVNKRHRFSYIPFSAGIRNCIDPLAWPTRQVV
nr:cytochrome P450 4c3-like isoform X3 [Cherax quadricarinatus]